MNRADDPGRWEKAGNIVLEGSMAPGYHDHVGDDPRRCAECRWPLHAGVHEDLSAYSEDDLYHRAMQSGRLADLDAWSARRRAREIAEAG